MTRGMRFVCAVMMWVGFVAPAWAAVDHPQNVILIGWDGAQREHVEQCLARKELPSLQRLIDQGKYVKIDVEGVTDTKAGWSQILTGYYPQVTGVYSNSRYQPVPKGLSIFERLESRFGKDRFVTVAVIAKKQHCGEINPPQKIRVEDLEKQPAKAAKNKKKQGKAQSSAARKTQGKVIEEDGVKYRLTPGSPYYGMHTAVDVWEYGLMEDRTVGTRALELLDTYKDKPFFFFIHFAEVDHSGHKSGENSQAYNDALISNDLWTGKIMDKIKELGLADKTQIYVTADHGFDEDAKTHRFAPYVFLATNNQAVAREGRRQDITPTIYEALGVEAKAFEPPLDGLTMTKPEQRPPVKLTPPKRAAKAATQTEETHPPDVIFVATPQDAVDKMLELARVTKNDVLYDLGCGDGRIIVTAAKKYGCRAYGFDVDSRRIKESKANVEKEGVGNLVTVEQKDIFTLDLSQASVVTLYLLPSLNVKLIPQLEKLKPGCRIVSHDFDMQGVVPDQVLDGDGHILYLWTTPLKKEPQTRTE
jgi:hypothetical protein